MDAVPTGPVKKHTKIKYSLLRIFTGSDLSRRRLPIMSAESEEKGPVVWLTACVHGDEVGGMVVIHEIFKYLRSNGLLSGSLFAFPLMNPLGFETASRQITFSREDLNRSFPGNPRGSLAERIAAQIFTMLIETGPTVVLDLHNDWMKSIPYTVIDPAPQFAGSEHYARARDFAGRTGFLMILESDSLEKSLSFSLLAHAIPALTIELGESLVVNETNVRFGVKSILNILSHLGMIKNADIPFSHPLTATFPDKVLSFSDHAVSSTSGIVRFLVKPGDLVRKDQPVAKIYNSFGKLQETIAVRNDGIVLGHADTSVAFPGSRVMAFGIY